MISGSFCQGWGEDLACVNVDQYACLCSDVAIMVLVVLVSRIEFEVKQGTDGRGGVWCGVVWCGGRLT